MADQDTGRLVAHIAELQQQLADAQAATAQVLTERDLAHEQTEVSQSKIAIMTRQITELAEQVAIRGSPPSGSAITIVQRYLTPHGTEHELLPDAERAMKIHAWVTKTGMTQQQAEAAVLAGLI